MCNTGQPENSDQQTDYEAYDYDNYEDEELTTIGKQEIYNALYIFSVASGKKEILSAVVYMYPEIYPEIIILVSLCTPKSDNFTGHNSIQFVKYLK